MSKSVTIKAAWIAGGCAIVAAVIYGIIALLGNAKSSRTMSVVGNNNNNVVMVGEGKNVTIDQSVNAKPESQLTGILMPANEPDPLNECGIPNDAFKVFLGTNVSWNSDKKSHTALRIGNEDIIKLKHTPNGLYISAILIREDGREIARIIDNQFSVNPNNYFELKRPDRHELQVYNKLGKLHFKVRYINENAVLFQGTFQGPGTTKVNVSEDEIFNNVFHIKNSCSGNNGGASFAF